MAATSKKPGVCYAFTRDGLELPVIDITHPAFRIERPTLEKLDEMMAKAVAKQEAYERYPAMIRKFLFWIFSRKSIIMQGVMNSHGTFLTGMNTYLMKLGPDTLLPPLGSRVDLAMVSSVPALGLRLRLQNTVGYLVEGLLGSLASRPDARLIFINIAGGPCADTLNTLLVLQKHHPDLLRGRKVLIRVFDLHDLAPEFAKKSLEALRAPDAPLEELMADLAHIPYDWSRPQDLVRALGDLSLKNDVVAVSSEGGLFCYGSNADIAENLKVLTTFTPDDAVLVGSLSVRGGPGAVFNRLSHAATIPRSMDEFDAMALACGWKVKDNVTEPLNVVVRMVKASNEDFGNDLPVST